MQQHPGIGLGGFRKPPTSVDCCLRSQTNDPAMQAACHRQCSHFSRLQTTCGCRDRIAGQCGGLTRVSIGSQLGALLAGALVEVWERALPATDDLVLPAGGPLAIKTSLGASLVRKRQSCRESLTSQRDSPVSLGK